MAEASHKRVDESWKDQVEREKERPKPPVPQSQAAAPAPKAAEPPAGLPEARFDLFLSSLAMEALIALGDAPHPITRKQSADLGHARYLIDVLGILEEKTRGNLAVDEDRLLKDTLYQLRMRYMAKAGGA